MLLDLTKGDRIPPAALALGLAGVVPYWAAALVVLGDAAPSLMVQAGLAIVAYGAVGLAFLGGIRWGLAMRPVGASRQAGELALSIGAPLLALAALVAPPVIGVAVIIAGLLSQSLWDQISAEAGRLPGWFARLRTILTTLAVVPLLGILTQLLVAGAP